MLSSAKSPGFPVESDSLDQDNFSVHGVPIDADTGVDGEDALVLQPEVRKGDWIGRTVVLVSYLIIMNVLDRFIDIYFTIRLV